MDLSLLLLAVGALVWMLLNVRGTFQNRSLQLVRIVVPSWRFFDQTGDHAVLELQVDGQSWIDALPALPRSAPALLYNARGNLRFAEHSLLEQFVTDLSETPPESLYTFETSVSYQLVERLARKHLPPQVGRFAFRVRNSEQVLWVSRSLEHSRETP